jgi:hypothetical protein
MSDIVKLALYHKDTCVILYLHELRIVLINIIGVREISSIRRQ